MSTIAQSSTHSQSSGIPKQAYLVFAIVGMALLMASIDSTIVSVSLPTMMTELNTNLAWIGWAITGYQFANSIMMPIAGKLSDDLGRKKIFLAAIVLFTLSSMAAGIAPNVYVLIICRILQGLGGGAFLPSATGIVGDAFGDKRAAAIGMFGSVFPMGAIIGPNLGGFIIDHFSWRWIFFVNVPLGICIFVAGMMLLKKGSAVGIGKRIDLAGAWLFSGAILAVLSAITTWADNPQGAGLTTWLLFALGAVLLGIFIRRETTVDNPIIELNLLHSKQFLAVNVFNFLWGLVVMGLFSLIPYYAVTAYGMTAGESGIILTPRSIIMAVTSTITSLFIIRFRYRPPIIIGCIVIAAGLFLLSPGYHNVTIAGWHMSNVVLLSLIVAVGGIGIGITNPPANNAVLDMYPEKMAAVTGMRGMFRATGGVFGTAVVVLILSHYTNAAGAFQTICLMSGILMLLLIPLVFFIPDIPSRRKTAHHAAAEE